METPGNGELPGCPIAPSAGERGGFHHVYQFEADHSLWSKILWTQKVPYVPCLSKYPVCLTVPESTVCHAPSQALLRVICAALPTITCSYPRSVAEAEAHRCK